MIGSDDHHPRSSSSPNVLFFGASVVDLITYTSRFPKPGETICGNHFSKGFGGKTANACVMSARIGLKTAIIVKLGDDLFGKEMIQNFKEHDINSDNVVVSKESHTAVAAICVDEIGQNTIVYVPGAANFLPNELESINFKNIKLLVTTFECLPESLFFLLKLAKDNKVTTLVNAAPPFPGHFNYDIFKYCDILCLNEAEAESVCGMPIQDSESARLACNKLGGYGAETIILTMGEKGAFYYKEKEKIFLHIPVKKTVTVDTTGAGDAFIGSLAYFLSVHPHLAMDEMIRRSCDIATISVQKRGTQSSYPWRKDLPEYLFL